MQFGFSQTSTQLLHKLTKNTQVALVLLGSKLGFGRTLDSLSSANRMHDFSDFRQPNFTKFEHNTSLGVAMNPFGTKF